MSESPEATALIKELRRLRYTVATAESLTGGLVSATLASVSGASNVLLGGVVAYDPAIKHRLLGVDPNLLETHGTVHIEVARQMAIGAVNLLHADLGLATTGVAGPGPLGDHQPGTGYIALVLPNGDILACPFHVAGSRNEVRERVVAKILTWATHKIKGFRVSSPKPPHSVLERNSPPPQSCSESTQYSARTPATHARTSDSRQTPTSDNTQYSRRRNTH